MPAASCLNVSEEVLSLPTLGEIIGEWHTAKILEQKKHIQTAAGRLAHAPLIDGKPVLLGDDAAAIPVEDGFLLLAAEGVWPPLLRANPRLAGRSCMLANINDIYAMGGRPLAVVDVLLSTSPQGAGEALRGMRENAERYGVPIVGGHTTLDSGVSALAVCILGKARRLLSSYNAQPGDKLMMVGRMHGQFRPNFDFWDCSSGLESSQLKGILELLPMITENGLCDTAKDISMAGLLGTVVMLMETSGRGALISLDDIPRPPEADFRKWLRAFPSYGFILSLRPRNVPTVQALFRERGLFCESFGTVIGEPVVTVTSDSESAVLWELSTPLTGFGHQFREVEHES